MVRNSFYAVLLASIASFTVVTGKEAEKKDSKMQSRKALIAKVAIVDMRKIVAQDPADLESGSAEWKDVFNSFLETIKPAQEELLEMENQYKKKVSEFQSLQKSHKSGVTSQETLNKKADEIRALVEQSQVKANQFQQFSQNELMKVQKSFMPKVTKAVTQILNEQGWDFAIHKDALASDLTKKEFEITNDVLRNLNNQYTQDKAAKEKSKKK